MQSNPDDSCERPNPKHVEASITLVEHGYQIDVRDYTQSPDDKKGVLISTVCRDFGGEYDIGELAKTVTAALFGMMEKLEDYHKEVLHLRDGSIVRRFDADLDAPAAEQF